MLSGTEEITTSKYDYLVMREILQKAAADTKNRVN